MSLYQYPPVRDIKSLEELQKIVSAQGGDSKETFRNDYAITPVTTLADVTISAALTADVTSCEIFDSSGQTLVLKVNGVEKIRIFPGGNDDVKGLSASIGDSIELRAESADANVGEFIINFFG